MKILRECGHHLARILDMVVKEARPGISTAALDVYAERLIREAGGDPVFKGYRTLGSKIPYPGSLCVSVNDEVVHAIPSETKILKEGDIVGLDIGMRWPSFVNPPAGRTMASEGNHPINDLQPTTYKLQTGLITDMAVTIGIGKISEKAERLITVTREALEKGISVLRPAIRLGDVGAIIQRHIEKKRFGVIRDLAGHGVGRELHEEPFVPNWGKRGSGPFVHEGSVLAVEPMATEGSPEVRLGPDHWTFRTRDGGLSAHFEHTVVVLKDGAEILTKM